MIKSLARYVVNYIVWIIPISSLFGLKASFLNAVGVRVGRNVKVNGHTWFYGRGRVHIGDHSWIGPRCRFYTHEDVVIEIGRDCDIAPEVVFVTGSHEVGNIERRAGKGICNGIVIEDGCWVGARTTLLGGVKVGKGSIVGAGSLVNKNIPPGCVAVGVPAKPVKWLNAVEAP